jgi:hypothetical protein
MVQNVLNYISAGFSLCSFIFFLIGCISYAVESDTVKNIPWVTIDGDDMKLWFGLYRLVYHTSGVAGPQNYDQCDFPFCDTCADAGQSTAGLLVIATIFAGLSTLLSATLGMTPNTETQKGNFFSSFISALFSIIGFGLFMGPCFKRIGEYADSIDVDTEWGASSVLVCLGLLMMWVVVILQILALIVGAPAASA